MNFKLFARTRPLFVGIAVSSPGNTGNFTNGSWRLPFGGVWLSSGIGGGGGSGAYSNSHGHGSYRGLPGNVSSNTSYLPAEQYAGITLGGGGAGGDSTGLNHFPGDAGNASTLGSGGSGGAASDGNPISAYVAPDPVNTYSVAQIGYFFGTANADYALDGNTGRGGDTANGFLSFDVNGNPGYRGACVFTCVG